MSSLYIVPPGHDALLGRTWIRTPVTTTTHSINAYYEEQILQISNEKITASIIARETKTDPELSDILQEIRSSNIESEYTAVNEIVFRGDRIIIIKSLRSIIFSELHECHLVIQKMKQLAHRYVTRAGIEKEMEQLVKSWAECVKKQARSPKARVHPWKIPAQNWEWLYIDHAWKFLKY